MCGISGVINNQNFILIDKIVEIQRKRGPDNLSFKIFPNINSSLGHNRLSIIDISHDSDQPMFDINKNYSIVFNGEIYNYLELRRKLEDRGYKFRTKSDTEVILISYLEWKEDCVLYFRGMFAFVILNLSSGETFLARDRFGIKPLIYSQLADSLIFASELKSFQCLPFLNNKIRNESICEFLMYGSISQPNTLFENIFQLSGGHYAIFKNNKLTISKYWDIYDNTIKQKSDYKSITYRDAVDEFKLKFNEAISYHFISDVTIGSFLSGGVDSSILVGLMSKKANNKIDTFTVSFSEKYKQFDESTYAKIVAKHFNANYNYSLLDYKNFKSDYLEILESLDQPSIEGINTFYASKLASKNVKVVLSGLGGDELLAGYPHYNFSYFANKLLGNGIFNNNCVKLELFKKISPRLNLILKYFLGNNISWISSIRKYMDNDDIRSFLISKDALHYFVEQKSSHKILKYFKEDLDIIDQISYFELNTYLTDTLLRDSDIMSMHFGLELRPVFLDHILSEFIFSLPSQFKFNGKLNKRILIDAFSDLLPAEILNRKKVGFELPYNLWISEMKNSQNTWKDMVFDHYAKSIN